MTNKKTLLEHQKRRLNEAIEAISSPIFSTKTSSDQTGEVFSFKSFQEQCFGYILS
ncbi:hypothetical protein [Pedobacter sp. Hv1]|uniref:hypothetical protein n=1 Tax=Pedobacter sp. Hv1 TaxID=1740090 RepID=UPI000A7A5D82|nr:hypothetical protein [Pedobacter sp. Hv1]